MGQNRRNFLKYSVFVGGLSALTFRLSGLFNSAWAVALDSKIKRQGYTTALPPQKASDLKKYNLHSSKANKAKVGLAPNCQNCKHFKPVVAKQGWGKCAIVGATGRVGKLVSEKGWCKLWALNKKAI